MEINLNFETIKIGVLGMGYVGLPLALEFGKKYSVIGFDVNLERVADLKAGKDVTLEVSAQDLLDSERLRFSSAVKDLTDCNVYIVAVPTPVDQHNSPDLSFLLNASEMLGSVIKAGDIIIYEATVYPGATEEVCIPLVERSSGLTFNIDFFAGYSPERLNPGDREHRISNIMKVTSGSTEAVADFVDRLYASIISVGTFKAASMKVAEAAKVIENTQRDVNIALINELSIIFNRLEIDTLEVLEAAETKWNFLPFRPGLVGGHCIGVDPYYLTHKAKSVGYHPEMILAGRRLNDGMASYVVSQLVKTMIKKRIQVQGAKVLIMGLAFKEDCPDLRNTKVVDIIHELKDYNISPDVYDPWCSPEVAREVYGIELILECKENSYDSILLAVGHKCFKKMGCQKVKDLGKDVHVLYDLKYIFNKEDVDIRL